VRANGSNFKLVIVTSVVQKIIKYLMEAFDSRFPNQISTFKLLPSAALLISSVMNLKERFNEPNGPVTTTFLAFTSTLTKNKLDENNEKKREKR
jgi:hypothetical protein